MSQPLALSVPSSPSVQIISPKKQPCRIRFEKDYKFSLVSFVIHSALRAQYRYTESRIKAQEVHGAP